MKAATSESDMTSLATSSPSRSPKAAAAYYVQSPSRDSHDDGDKSSSTQATPVYNNSPIDSPSHQSFSRHSRVSSASRFSGNLRSASGSRPNPSTGRKLCRGVKIRISGKWFQLGIAGWAPAAMGGRGGGWVVRLAAALVVGFVLGSVDASPGDVDPRYRTCVEECHTTGIIGENIISHCQSPGNEVSVGSSWYTQEPLYMQWKQLNCRTDCRYYCMMQREGERQSHGLSPVKYHGQWPFIRVSVFQEPLSAALSAVNLLMHFTGWVSYFLLVNYKLPVRPQTKRTYYEYTGLWHIYAILSMNAWFWSSIFHTRDIDLTEKLDYSSAVALLGYSLILSLLRTFDVKDEATRVMFAAPMLAFVTTHILYLNFYELDYGWNMKVCVVMAVVQLLAWAIWAGVTQHPSRFKLWVVVLGGALAMLLEVYDFPPYKGYADAHSMWHASTIPLTYLWWSFIKDDAEFRTSTLIKKAK